MKKTKKKYICIPTILLILLCIFLLCSKPTYPSQCSVSKVISENVSSIDFTLHFDTYANTSFLQISSENLAPETNHDSLFYRITEWFPIDSTAGYLTMYGGFNYAKWEFSDNDHNIITVDHSSQMYNDCYEYKIENRATDVVEIPPSATYARVTYINKFNFDPIECAKFIYHKKFSSYKDKLTYYKTLISEPLYIVYGRFPSTSVLTHCQTIQLPELDYNDSIIYKDNTWFLSKGNELTTLDLDTPNVNLGSTLTLLGDSAGTLTIDGQKNMPPETEGIYGIQWATDSTSIVGERIYDSQDLRFNYILDDSFAGIYANGFDNIYPWCDIKLCTIDSNGDVSYDVDASALNDIMVEIPVFYYNRTVTEDYETIMISADPKNGFSVDPAFLSPNGINDKIYISAYQSSLVNNEIKSSSSATPLINLSYNQINELLSDKGDNWDELDLVTLNAIQKLFLVETGIRNSQCLFTGNVASCFIWSSDNDPKYAQVSESDTNIICIKKDDYTKRFEVGDTVNIVTGSTWYDAYPYFTDNFRNDDETWNRTIKSIHEDKKYLYIEFSGQPVDLVKDVSIIANLPMRTGNTDFIPYATGTYSGIFGKTAFKYRHMENLWGNICVILDNALVDSENNITVTYPDNSKQALSFQSPVQKLAASTAHSNDCAIHSLGYDEKNSAILYPETLNNGSLLTNTYGDWFMKIWRENTQQYITYGMTWDMDNYAGLFAYRVDPNEDTHKVENGSRIIYRNK